VTIRSRLGCNPAQALLFLDTVLTNYTASRWRCLLPLLPTPHCDCGAAITFSGWRLYALQNNVAWSWDISYCASVVRGQHWYLYLIMDIYSRKIIAWEVHDTESGELAKQLLERALLREGCWHQPPVLHSDNGAPMTSYTLKARLTELGMLMSYSRPRVSNDNPYSEALFRTVKYCPAWPTKGFASLGAVREWMLAFERAYNEQHLHSGIQYVTPADRHRGVDQERLERRNAGTRYTNLRSSDIRNAGRATLETGKSPARSRLTRKKCTKSSVINRLLKRSHLDNWVENHR